MKSVTFECDFCGKGWTQSLHGNIKEQAMLKIGQSSINVKDACSDCQVLAQSLLEAAIKNKSKS